jgi:hypothetical protein
MIPTCELTSSQSSHREHRSTSLVLINPELQPPRPASSKGAAVPSCHRVNTPHTCAAKPGTWDNNVCPKDWWPCVLEQKLGRCMKGDGQLTSLISTESLWSSNRRQNPPPAQSATAQPISARTSRNYLFREIKGTRTEQFVTVLYCIWCFYLQQTISIPLILQCVITTLLLQQLSH